MATINVSDLATELGTDGRTARKFLRSVTPKDDQPGKGGRWAIEKAQVRSLKSKFAAFQKAAAEKAANADEPTDAELEEIDADGE
jgi:hypothetical protein